MVPSLRCKIRRGLGVNIQRFDVRRPSALLGLLNSTSDQSVPFAPVGLSRSDEEPMRYPRTVLTFRELAVADGTQPFLKTSRLWSPASFLSGGEAMPWKTTLQRAKNDKEEGKAPSTQAGEFVREEMEHIRRGKHGASNTKQAIAIGLSKARRAGVKLAPPKPGTTSSRTRKQAQRDLAKAERGPRKTSHKRSVARARALKREPHSPASHSALSKQASSAAARRSKPSRSAAAKKAASTRQHRHAA